jgi:hypothetical protein
LALLGCASIAEPPEERGWGSDDDHQHDVNADHRDVDDDHDAGDHLGADIDHPGDEVSGTTTAPGSLGRSHRCR